MKEVYAALDVSDKTTHICVVDKDGSIAWRGVCATDPDALATVLKKRCPAVVRVVLETGPLSAFLYHAQEKGKKKDTILNFRYPLARS